METKEYKCPNCGAKDRVVETLLEEEKANGRVADKEYKLAAAVEVIEVRDRRQTPNQDDKISIALILWDFCLKCGTKYVFRIEHREGTFQVRHRGGDVIPKLFLPKDIRDN